MIANNPKVTVLMPVYNVAPFVCEAIESVLNQTTSDFELLIINDGSTDRTRGEVLKFTDRRIRFVENECNIGLANTLNRGIELAQGEYIARMDGDDIAVNNWLEKEIKVLDNYPEIGICSGGFQRFGSRSGIVRFPQLYEDIKVQMLFNCSVIVPTFRKSVFKENNLKYRQEAFPAEDYRLWAECLRVTQIYNIPETLFYYRMHSSQICTSLKDRQIPKVNEVRLYMLSWLNPEFSMEEEEFFINTFTRETIKDISDLESIQAFAQILVLKNREYNHFKEEALKKTFRYHIKILVLNWAIDTFFINGYSITNYCKFLNTGRMLNLSLKHNFKIFLKSILNRK